MSKWFKGREYSFAIGVLLAIQRIGSTATSYFSPIIYKHSIFGGGNLGGVLFIGFVVCLISLLSGICIIMLDKYADKEEHDDKDKFKSSDLRTLKLAFWLIVFNVGFTYSAILSPLQDLP